MTNYIPDLLTLIGFFALVTGVIMLYGVAVALLVGGLVLMAAGVAMARRQAG